MPQEPEVLNAMATGTVGRRDRVVDAGLVVLALLVDVALWLPNDATRWGGPALAAVATWVATGAALALLWRRRRPLAVFACCWVAGWAPVLAPGHEPFAALSVAVFTVASRCRTRVSLGVLALALVPLGVNSVNAVYAGGNRSVTGLLAVGTVWSLVGLAAWGTGRFVFLARERAELQRREHELQSAAVLTQERLRLARDLHDVVASSVGAMIVQAGVARALAPAGEELTVGRLRTIEATGAQAMVELHGLLALLRSAHDASRTAGGPAPAEELVEAVHRLVAETRACGAAVEVTGSGPARPLGRETSSTAYRVLQECLANVVKHGGPDPRAVVELSWASDELTLGVWNDRRVSADPRLASSGFGLLGIRERVLELGGELQAADDEEGYRVRVVLPLGAGSDRSLPPARPPAAPVAGQVRLAAVVGDGS